MSAPIDPSGLPAASAASLPAAAAPAAPPVVVLDGVFARDMAGPRGTTRGALLGATAALGPGVHAFLGAPEDGTVALCDTLAGLRRPLRGSVRIAGEDPWTSPAARSRTGALLAAPEIPHARSVRACVEQVLAALGRSASEAGEVLAELGLGLLAARPTAALSYAETRAVELALALAVVKRAPSPAVLVLFEPCADLAVPSAARAVEEVIAAQRASGAVVVLATSSPADARRLADEVWILHRGAVLRREAASSQALAAGDVEIAVTVAAGDGAAVRALAASLAESPAVRAALWEDPPQGSGRAPVLRVRGANRDACALAVLDAAARAGIALESITSSVPDLPAVRSAAVAWVQRARAAAQPSTAPKPSSTSPTLARPGMPSQDLPEAASRPPEEVPNLGEAALKPVAGGSNLGEAASRPVAGGLGPTASPSFHHGNVPAPEDAPPGRPPQGGSP